jgi:hypothetical protein
MAPMLDLTNWLSRQSDVKTLAKNEVIALPDRRQGAILAATVQWPIIPVNADHPTKGTFQ